jgi:hypothetical protein
MPLSQAFSTQVPRFPDCVASLRSMGKKRAPEPGLMPVGAHNGALKSLLHCLQEIQNMHTYIEERDPGDKQTRENKRQQEREKNSGL